MPRARKTLVICVDNEGYEVSLEQRKLYLSIPDARADKLGKLRVIDESGDDYVYPKEFFVAVVLPRPIRRAILQVET
jgi:hypothetical protein